MDELVKMVSEKAGISTDQAKVAIGVVADFLKKKAPPPVAAQIDSLLAGGTPDIGSIAGSVGGLFGS